MLQLCLVEVNEWEREAVCWLMAAGSALSLIGAGFVLLCYFVWSTPGPRGRNPLASLVAVLAAADFGWATTNLMSLASIVLDLPTSGSQSWPACVVFRSLFQFFALATVLWTCCISYFLYRTISNSKKRGIAWYEWIGFHLFCWGLPLAGSLILALYGHTSLARHPIVGLCFPRQYYRILSWMVPITLAFVWNLILYCAIIMKLRSLMPWSSKSISRRLGFRFSLYLFVFLLTWAPSVLNGIIETVNERHQSKCHIVALLALSTFLLTSQGLWNGLVYGFGNKRIRDQFSSPRLALRATIMLLLSPLLVPPAFVYYLFRTLSCCWHRCRCCFSDSEEQDQEQGGAPRIIPKKHRASSEADRKASRALLEADPPFSINDDVYVDVDRSSTRLPR